MASFFSEIERIIKENGGRGLDVLMIYAGLELEIHRPVKGDIYSQVHGHDAGGSTVKVHNFKGVLEGDDFFPSTSGFTGDFEEGFLYTDFTEVKVGDIIVVKRDDGKLLRYKVSSKESLGLTTEVFYKWKLNAMQ